MMIVMHGGNERDWHLEWYLSGAGASGIVQSEGSDMKPSAALAVHHEAIRRIVEAHNAHSPRVFGSAAVGTDREDSDLDLLVEPAPGMTLLDLGAIRHELKQLLGVQVDVLTPRSLPAEFRDRVLAEAASI
jgi:predicted nucleotidyltransferase